MSCGLVRGALSGVRKVKKGGRREGEEGERGRRVRGGSKARPATVEAVAGG